MHCNFTAKESFNHPDLYLLSPVFNASWEPIAIEIPEHLRMTKPEIKKFDADSIKFVSNYNRHFSVECNADTLYLENTYFDLLSSDFGSVKHLHLVNSGTPACKPRRAKFSLIDTIAPNFVTLIYKITPEKFAVFPNLETLQITDPYSEFDSGFRESIKKHCPKLKSIKINE